MPSAAARYAAGRLIQMASYWPSFAMSSLGSPLIYLMALLVGMAPLLGDEGPDGYVRTSALAIMVGAAAATGGGYALWPIRSGFLGDKRFIVAIQGPLSVSSVVVGETLAVASRVAIQSLAFWIVACLMGVSTSDVISSVIACVLTSLALFTPLMAFSASGLAQHVSPAAVDRILITPMFLLSGVWVSVRDLPQPLWWIGAASPISIGAHIARVPWGDWPVLRATDVAYIFGLAGVAAVGLLVAKRTFKSRLIV